MRLLADSLLISAQDPRQKIDAPCAVARFRNNGNALDALEQDWAG